jgi:mono/diheme cytochrome c family protein
MSPAEAAKLARESQEAIVSRLHKGGQDMPAFSHLSESEIRSLLAYLRQLADVPNAESQQIAIEEPALRTGEHIVKSTCHVCHATSGPNPDAKQLADGAIPPLSTLTSRVSRERFIQKVTHGAPIVMGSPELTLRGRMPVFYYLSEEEAADAYLYLMEYPPDQELASERALALSDPTAVSSNPEPPQNTASPSVLPPAAEQKADDTSDMETVAFLSVSLLLVLVLLAGMVGFTVWEVRRLSADQGRRAVKGQVPHTAGTRAARAIAGHLVA